MEPWQSWALVLIVGGCAYYYYSHQGNTTRARGRSIVRPHEVPRRRDVKPKAKAEVDSASSDSTKEQNRRKKQAKKPAPKVEQPVPIVTRPDISAQKEQLDEDKDWAKRLAENKKGTSLAPPTRSDSRTKTVKQSAARANAQLSTNSSTTGADADDDLSPAVSPTLVASANAPSGKNVSDMLEPAPNGPSVLRLTEPAQPPRAKKAQQQPREEVKETKKQRQNRKKAEEKKLQREQDEKERRVILENQLRTAREARGEPAKNGMKAATAPASNAWTASGAGPSASVNPNDAPLLDTFEPDGVSTASSSGVATNGTGATSPSVNYTELPSEQEQMRMLMSDSGWSTVPKGKKGRKKPAPGEDTTGNEDSDIAAPVEVAPKKAPVIKESVPKKVPQPVMQQHATYLINDADYPVAGDPRDSDWAVV